MNKLIIALVCIISPIFLAAHNPLSAKYYLETGEKVSLLNINLSQKGVEQLLLKEHGKDLLNTIDQKQYKELIVAYIKANFFFTVNNELIELKEGGIKLGSHQTDLKFVLPPFSKTMETFDIHIPAFKNNGYHQTIFSYNVFGKVDKVILDVKNEYRSSVDLNEQPKTIKGSWSILFGLSFFASTLFLYFKYRTEAV